MYTWEFAKAQYTTDLHGWTRFVSMQPHYNLLYREEEREMLPFCLDQGVGVIPWSPLARGRLTRPLDQTTERSGTDNFGTGLYASTEGADRAVIDAVGTIADKRGVPRAQIALAWVAAQPAVSAPIVGATKPHHLTDAVAGLALELTDDEKAALEEPYVPHEVSGLN
jgi:aryl-alcohol dehydrogenase (NADP+)